MDKKWVGKAVSIECKGKLGVFQGIISQCSASEISIVWAFRNGIPLKKPNTEITLACHDITKINLLPPNNNLKQNNSNNNNKVSSTSWMSSEISTVRIEKDALKDGDVAEGFTGTISASCGSVKVYTEDAENSNTPETTFTKRSSSAILANEYQNSRTADCYNRTNSVAQFFGNLIPPKVEVLFGGGVGLNANTTSKKSLSNDFHTTTQCNNNSKNNIPKSTSCSCSSMSNVDRKLSTTNTKKDTSSTSTGNLTSNSTSTVNLNNASSNENGNINSGNGAGRHKQRKQKARRDNSSNITFATSINDPSLYEDFDFEGNLALFDKRAIWDKIDSSKKPDLVQHTVTSRVKKSYRHDENILDSVPVQMRQIISLFPGSSDFVTDEGLIIPTIPINVRRKIESNAQKCGLSIQRQLDILARGTTDLAMLLLGGARRFIPNNRHQWPVVTIICEKSDDFRTSNVGAATGRHLASHGLKVVLYIDEDSNIEHTSIEILLFKATGNKVVYSVNDFPSSDLVILSSNAANIPADIMKWLSQNRASLLAIDPPPNGINKVCIKYSILPILPLNGISPSNCGNLYLCNLGIPEKFYYDAGVKYKSPFGHKFVIPLHLKD